MSTCLKPAPPAQASFNNFTELPEGLGALPRLEMCRVACCKIESLPAGLGAAPALAWLSLGGNPICAQPPPHRHVHLYSHHLTCCLDEDYAWLSPGGDPICSQPPPHRWVEEVAEKADFAPGFGPMRAVRARMWPPLGAVPCACCRRCVQGA